MHTKLAGHIPLHEMIANTINGARNKLAAEGGDEKDEAKKKVLPFMKKKEEKGEEKEKKSSAFDLSDPDELEKLASALEELGEKIAADSKYIGGEKGQGGEVLATNTQVPGTQPYKKDSSKSHNVPNSTPEKAPSDQKGAATATETDDKPGKLLKYLHSKYPEKGVLKTAASSVKEKIEAMKDKENESGKEKESAIPPPPGVKEEKKEAKGEDKKEETKEKESASECICPKGGHNPKCPMHMKEKKSAALDYILNKVATFGAQEKKMGGETLDSASEQGPKPQSGSQGGNNARSHIGSNKAAIDMKKVEGKGPQKKMLSEVLTEPAQSKGHDSKVHENLRNASKGGVKIAEAKAFLQKIAGDEKHPQHEKLKEAMKKRLEKKSQGGLGMGAPMATTPPPMPMGR